jgi:AraC-like DNA-binding protein
VELREIGWRIAGAARRLRLDTHKPCRRSGFNDYSYFSQKFRRRFGHAPSAHAGNVSPEGKIIESLG